jgi:hypothetical protein
LAFREQRLKDLKKEERKGRFGSVLPISRDDYNREVTEASKVDDRDEDEDEGDDEIKGTGWSVSCTRRGTCPTNILLHRFSGSESYIYSLRAGIMPPASG